MDYQRSSESLLEISDPRTDEQSHYGELRRIAAKIVSKYPCSTESKEDLVVDGLVQVYRVLKRKNLTLNPKLFPYCAKIIRNITLTELYKMRRCTLKELPDFGGVTMIYGYDMVSNFEVKHKLEWLYNQVDDEDKKLIDLLRLGLRDVQSAQIMNMNINTFRVLVHRKRKVWKSVLEKYEEDWT